MKKIQKAIAVIGEGITEKYYIESLRGIIPFQVQPKQLNKKASNLLELDRMIEKSINDGYDEVYCLIDMDGKEEGKVLTEYTKLKIRYHDKTHGKAKDGIKCKVIFIETERCIELWFLYHFTTIALTRKFNSYSELEGELKKYLPNYEKSERYFKSVANLHNALTKKQKPNRSVRQAIKNAQSSIISKNKDVRNHTYSEMHNLMEVFGIEPDLFKSKPKKSLSPT